MAMKEFSKKDKINAKSASIALKDVKGDIVIDGIYVDAVIDNDGVKRDGMYLRSTDGSYYCTISENCIKMLDDLLELLDECGTVTIGVQKAKSKSDREYLSILVR